MAHSSESYGTHDQPVEEYNRLSAEAIARKSRSRLVAENQELRSETTALRAKLETVEAETRERCAKAVNDLDVGPLYDGVIVEALEAIRNLEPRHD